jgi:carboxyl-terminal processing protease
MTDRVRGGGPALALLAGALLVGCPADSHCGPLEDKATVVELVGTWYLYPDLLPPFVDQASYPDAAALMAHLTASARAAGLDRGWSYVTTVAAVQQHYAAAQAVGHGFTLLVRGTRLLVGQVMKGSAAADAGFVRGDELLRIGPDAQALVPVADLIAAGTVSQALGSGVAGVTRLLEVATAAGAVEQRSLVTRVFGLDPVPAWHVSGTTAYLDLRTFIQPAEADLRTAFQAFQAAGVTDLVVDLRYNGGGLVSTAVLLANLIGASRATGLLYEEWFNPARAAYDVAVPFSSVTQQAGISRVAFLTTGLTASASELVINALDPWVQVALVGEPTYGKPVGQLGFQVTGCDTVVYVVAARFTNAAGHGGYYAGLPDGSTSFAAPLCAALDDLGHAQDDPTEGSHAAALAWLATGRCPPPPARPLPAAGRARAPMPPRPTPSQVEMPGLH